MTKLPHYGVSTVDANDGQPAEFHCKCGFIAYAINLPLAFDQIVEHSAQAATHPSEIPADDVEAYQLGMQHGETIGVGIGQRAIQFGMELAQLHLASTVKRLGITPPVDEQATADEVTR